MSQRNPRVPKLPKMKKKNEWRAWGYLGDDWLDFQDKTALTMHKIAHGGHSRRKQAVIEHTQHRV